MSKHLKLNYLWSVNCKVICAVVLSWAVAPWGVASSEEWIEEYSNNFRARMDPATGSVHIATLEVNNDSTKVRLDLMAQGVLPVMTLERRGMVYRSITPPGGINQHIEEILPVGEYRVMVRPHSPIRAQGRLSLDVKMYRRAVSMHEDFRSPPQNGRWYSWSIHGWGREENPAPDAAPFTRYVMRTPPELPESGGHGVRMNLTINIAHPMEVGFWRKVSCRRSGAALTFSVAKVENDADGRRRTRDRKELGSWSGQTGWQWVNYRLAPGRHSLTWLYMRERGQPPVGEDAAWIAGLRIREVARR